MGISSSACRLSICTLTWPKPSFNLFDYESSEYSRTNLRVDCPGYLIRKGFQITFLEHASPADDTLLQVELGKNQKYILGIVSKIGNPAGNLMRVVKPEEQILVKENDLIKLGRVEIRVKRLSKEYFPDVRPVLEQCGKAGIHNECRFCFNHQVDLINPLLSPCQCKGSLQYIHLECLRVWLKMRMVKEEEKGEIVKYHWENLKCELCHGGIESEIDLFRVEEEKEGEYSISIEITQTEEDGKKVSIFVVPIAKGEEGEKIIKIGRGKENEIRINDISVSRQHCTLIVREGKAYLQDNGSKFGTLIQVDGEMKVEKEEEIWLQAGRTLIKVANQYQY